MRNPNILLYLLLAIGLGVWFGHAGKPTHSDGADSVKLKSTVDELSTDIEILKKRMDGMEHRLTVTSESKVAGLTTSSVQSALPVAGTNESIHTSTPPGPKQAGGGTELLAPEGKTQCVDAFGAASCETDSSGNGILQCKTGNKTFVDKGAGRQPGWQRTRYRCREEGR